MPQVAIVMPKMSMTMTEGELLTWHCKPGDVIKAGDVVCEVATDKIDMEVEATATGTVVSLHGNPGDVIEVGVPLVMVEAESDDLLAGIFDAPAAPVVEIPVVETRVIEAPVAPTSAAPVTATSADVLATPKARAVAAEQGVDLKTVVGSGADGIIKHTDISDAGVKTVSASSADRSIEKRLKTRLAIARAIEASADIPAFSMTFRYKVDSLPKDPVKRVAKQALAWAKALRAFPELHAQWNNGDIATFADVKVAFSVMAAHGVVTPSVTIPQTISDSFVEELRGILRDAANGKIAVEHLSSSTTGFADLGSLPVIASAGILIRPQSTSIAVGETDNKDWLYFTINADHRISDPADVNLLAERFVLELRS
ncbi:MAG: dihydrolipoyllysine-residue succinyltransferase [Actinomycetota bacterium]